MLVIIALATVVLYILWEIIMRCLEPRNLPPGERWFPFRSISIRTEEGGASHSRLMNMAKIYGDVFTIKRGREIVVFVNSISAANEALRDKGNDFAGRVYSQACSLLTKKGNDSEGRNGFRYRITSLGLHLITKTCLDEKICKEAESLVRRFNETIKEPFDPKYKVYLAVVNSFCSVLFGMSYKINDPEFYDIVELNNRHRRILNNGEIFDRFPFLRYLPSDLVNDVNEIASYRDRLLKKKLKEHRSTFVGDNIRDLTDALLKALSVISGESYRTPIEQTITDDDLIMIIMNVFYAGVDPVSATLSWALTFLASHPHVQMKLHQELDDVIGNKKRPSLSDRSQLPYLEAVIQETLRLASPTPLSVRHRAVTDSSLGGFSVPKDSSVMFNIWAMHHDANQWETPDGFKPERFIDGNGKLLSLSSASCVPFDYGPGACLGQTFTMAVLFLFLSRLVQEFNFSNSPGSGPSCLQGTATVVREPRPFRIVVTKR